MNFQPLAAAREKFELEISLPPSLFSTSSFEGKWGDGGKNTVITESTKACVAFSLVADRGGVMISPSLVRVSSYRALHASEERQPGREESEAGRKKQELLHQCGSVGDSCLPAVELRE